METKVLVIGDACVDIYEDGRWYLSGNIVDTGVHLSRMGVPTEVVTAVGTDQWGEAFQVVLAEEGLDISGLQVLQGATAVTHMSLDGLNRVHGDYEEGVLANMQFGDEEWERAGDATLVHSALWGNAEKGLPKAKQAGALISFDFADRVTHPLIMELAGVVDYAFFSFAEPTPEVDEFLQSRIAEGARCVVATFGEKGSRAFDGDKFYDCGIVPAQVVNTVGAGDAYIAGFLYGVLTTGDIPQAMQKGAEISADVVSTFNPWRPVTNDEPLENQA